MTHGLQKRKKSFSSPPALPRQKLLTFPFIPHETASAALYSKKKLACLTDSLHKASGCSSPDSRDLAAKLKCCGKNHDG